MAKTLNLAEAFGQKRERPAVKLVTGGPAYDLKLPDEMDPRRQLKMVKLARSADKIVGKFEGMGDSEDMSFYEQAMTTLTDLLVSQIELLNEDLAKQSLSYAQMEAILSFYREETTPKAEEEETDAK